MSADHEGSALEVSVARPHELPECLAVRRRVFVEELEIDAELEVDGEDDDATHWIARLRGRCVGTARMRVLDDRAKAERVAVLSEVRGRKVGFALMQSLEAEARARGLDRVELHAQLAAVPFYRTNGYQSVGDTFIEADIPHQAMSKRL